MTPLVAAPSDINLSDATGLDCFSDFCMESNTLLNRSWNSCVCRDISFKEEIMMITSIFYVFSTSLVNKGDDYDDGESLRSLLSVANTHKLHRSFVYLLTAARRR